MLLIPVNKKSKKNLVISKQLLMTTGNASTRSLFISAPIA